MEQLYRLSTAMQEPLSLKEQLGRVLETATRLGLLDRIYLWALSPDGERLVNLAGAGFDVEEARAFEGFEIPLVEAGAMYQAFRNGFPAFDGDPRCPRAICPTATSSMPCGERFLVIP